MFPIIALGSAIGALFSIARGADWLSGKLSDPKGATSGAAQTSARENAAAGGASFAQTMTAQAAGQALPGALASPPPPTVSPTVASASHEKDYASLAQIEAGLAAYGQVGERHAAALN